MADTNQVLKPKQFASISTPIGEARTLQRKAFISNAFYEAEKRQICSKRWVGVLFGFDVQVLGNEAQRDVTVSRKLFPHDI